MNVTFEDLEVNFTFIPVMFILKDTIWLIQKYLLIFLDLFRSFLYIK